MRCRLTKVPLRLPRSRIVNVSPSRSSSAWRRETVTSSRKTSQSGERPISVRSPIAWKLSPALPPPERTTSAGPLDRCPPAAPRLLDSSGPRLTLFSPALAHEQRAAARAVASRLQGSESRTPGSRCGSLPSAEDRAEVPGIDVRRRCASASSAPRGRCRSGRAGRAGPARCRPPPARGCGSSSASRRRRASRARAAPRDRARPGTSPVPA